MHREIEKNIRRAHTGLTKTLRGSFEVAAVPHILREVVAAQAALKAAEQTLNAQYKGDTGGLPSEVDLGGTAYRVVRFDPQIDEHRREQGYLGAAVLENRGSLYVCPVLRGPDGDSILKPNGVVRIPR